MGLLLPLLTRWHVGPNGCMFLIFFLPTFSLSLCFNYIMWVIFYLFYPVCVPSFKGKENEHSLVAETLLCVWGEGGAWRKILTYKKKKPEHV